MSYYQAMRKALKEAKAKVGNDFDLVHVHVAYPAGNLVLRCKKPYILTEHFSGYHKNSGFKWNRFRRNLTLKILNKAKRKIESIIGKIGPKK